MYLSFKVSVVMPAYNEEEFIFNAVRAFISIPEVDEVIVVDNNSKDGTKRLAAQAGAHVITETKQGYGHASKTALMSATGDLVFIVEPDGTFRAHDIYKFLSYADEFDAVIGTRTSKSCIWRGANMGSFLRYGNAAVAKLLEYLHNGPCFTDVGCTYKMIRRNALQQIEPYLTVGQSHFSPQLTIVLVRTGMRCVEIPVHYRRRVGTSKITGSFWKAYRLGWKMIFMIVAYRFRQFPHLKSSISQEVLADIGDIAEMK
jgi:glycosyltransferase involved in cell wall biosynthesis